MHIYLFICLLVVYCVYGCTVGGKPVSLRGLINFQSINPSINSIIFHLFCISFYFFQLKNMFKRMN